MEGGGDAPARSRLGVEVAGDAPALAPWTWSRGGGGCGADVDQGAPALTPSSGGGGGRCGGLWHGTGRGRRKLTRLGFEGGA